MPDVMSIFYAASLSELAHFQQRSEQLGIFHREKPQEAEQFFETLMQEPFGIPGTIRKSHLQSDITALLDEALPATIKAEPFYDRWIEDMAQVCSTFCETQGTDAVSFWLGSERGCRRYHVDNVPMRLLVTYAGKGTEWLPDEAADRAAFANGEPNERIVKNPEAKQFMNAWDVSVFRGGPKGLLHRTPDDALTGPSILMRLDHPSFWKNIIRQRALEA